MDLRGTPTHVCPCGSKHFMVRCVFEDNEIVMYFRDMECALCGTLLTAPMPSDKEENV